MTTRELLDKVKLITEENIAWVKENIASYDKEQIHWKPTTGSWNIEENLAHLNTFSDYYHDTFKKKIETTRFRNTKDGFLSSPLGKSAWKSMQLGKLNNVRRRFKAVKGFNPGSDPSLIQENEISRFLNSQNELLEIISAAENVNLRRVKIPISISKIIRLRLGDALLFVVYHNERHVQQIKNLVAHNDFKTS